MNQPVLGKGHEIACKGNILIVDDTPDNLRLLSSMLTQQGHEVRSAISGAMALMSVRIKLPDLVLLDINMPTMNGYEVCTHLKANEQTRDIPVIFLSALGEALDKVKAFQVGGVDYITKPFQLQEVVIRVQTQLTLRQMQFNLEEAKENALKALAKEREINRVKSEFMTLLSHDFRTPLTSIRGYIGLLQQQISEEMRQRYFSKINASVEHLLHLLDEVLLLGTAELNLLSCQPSPIALDPFCRDLIESVLLATSNQHSIHLTCTGNCSQAWLDPTLLQQILDNLLSNAIKYSPNHPVVEFVLSCQDNAATFQVCDRGIGIPLKSQPHLFEVFYRSPNVGQVRGSGLGLAIVKKCVEAHQGQIVLESGVGSGTTVTVTLPFLPPNRYPNPK